MTHLSLFSGIGGKVHYYMMKQFSEETRQKMSSSAKARCSRSLPKAAFKWTPFCTKDQLIDDYHANQMTQDEIAKKHRVSQKVVWRAMVNYGIPKRKAMKRDQRGSKNSSWVGDAASYKTAHQRVNMTRGSAKNFPCSQCGTTDPSRCYDWANLTGNYPDVNDYSPMCRKCHRQFDKKRREVIS